MSHTSLQHEVDLVVKCVPRISSRLSWENPSTAYDHILARVDLDTIAVHLKHFPNPSLSFHPLAPRPVQRILDLLGSVVRDEILQEFPVDSMGYQKLSAFGRLIDEYETGVVGVAVDDFIQPSSFDPTEAKQLLETFTQLLRNLASPTYNDPNSGDKRLADESHIGDCFKHSGQWQDLLDSLVRTLAPREPGPCCEQHGQFGARIRLPFWRNQSVFGAVCFDLFLGSAGDDDDPFDSSCREVRISHPPKLSSSAATSLDLCDIMELNSVDVALGDDCNPTHILRDRERRLEGFAPSRSLSSMIQDGLLERADEGGNKLKPRQKASLSITLALGLMCIFRSIWPSARWQASDVFFLYGQGEIREIDSPYLSVVLTPELRGQFANTCQSEGLGNQQMEPAYFISFALLLLQIELGRSVNSTTSEKEMRKAVFDAIKGGNGSTAWERLKRAVLSLVNFRMMVRHIEASRDYEEWTRRFVYQEVVRPLKEILDSYDEPPDERRNVVVRKTVSTSISTPSLAVLDEEEVADDGDEEEKEEKEEKEEASPQETDNNYGRLYDDYEPHSNSDNRELKNAATKFFQKTDDFNQRFILGLGAGQARSIRVAILDSGLTKHNTDSFLKAAWKRVKAGCSWIGNDPDNWEDTYGHGTHVARLFLKVAPSAHLYIAKISKGPHVADLDAVAKAVTLAVKEWDVDIISMSLGLTKDDANLNDALDNILNSNVGPGRERIVFAAASNGGGYGGITFPARKWGVICINALDGSGGEGIPGRRINPPSTEGMKFATLGVEIESQWQGVKVWKTGTSFATPIAAGIAANILEFARHELTLDESAINWLYSHRGMKKVLIRLSAKLFGGDYIMVRPWTKANGDDTSREYLKRLIMYAITYDR